MEIPEVDALLSRLASLPAREQWSVLEQANRRLSLASSVALTQVDVMRVGAFLAAEAGVTLGELRGRARDAEVLLAHPRVVAELGAGRRSVRQAHEIAHGLVGLDAVAADEAAAFVLAQVGPERPPRDHRTLARAVVDQADQGAARVRREKAILGRGVTVAAMDDDVAALRYVDRADLVEAVFASIRRRAAVPGDPRDRDGGWAGALADAFYEQITGTCARPDVWAAAAGTPDRSGAAAPADRLATPADPLAARSAPAPGDCPTIPAAPPRADGSGAAAGPGADGSGAAAPAAPRPAAATSAIPSTRTRAGLAATARPLLDEPLPPLWGGALPTSEPATSELLTAHASSPDPQLGDPHPTPEARSGIPAAPPPQSDSARPHALLRRHSPTLPAPPATLAITPRLTSDASSPQAPPGHPRPTPAPVVHPDKGQPGAKRPGDATPAPRKETPPARGRPARPTPSALFIICHRPPEDHDAPGQAPRREPAGEPPYRLAVPGRGLVLPANRSIRLICSSDTHGGIDPAGGELLGLGAIGRISTDLLHTYLDMPATRIRHVTVDTHGRLTDPAPWTDPHTGDPNPAITAHIRLRDRTCRYPGCTIPAARCNLDHLIARAHGGLTTCDCLWCLCNTHHQGTRHQTGVTVTGDTNHTVTITLANGTTLLSNPPCIDPATRYRLGS